MFHHVHAARIERVMNTIVEPWETEDLSTGHYVHLEHHPVRSNTLRIVFLHGLTQNLECWRGTAERIVSSNHLRAECVLIDMIGHGKTLTPGGIASRVRPDVMSRQVQRVLEKIGWMSTPSSSSPSHALASKITLAGLSLGGAVSLLWSEQHLDSVARIVRVAAAGLDETWYQSPLSSLPLLCRSTGLPNLISGLSSRLTTTALARNQFLLQFVLSGYSYTPSTVSDHSLPFPSLSPFCCCCCCCFIFIFIFNIICINKYIILLLYCVHTYYTDYLSRICLVRDECAVLWCESKNARNVKRSWCDCGCGGRDIGFCSSSAHKEMEAGYDSFKVWMGACINM